MELRDLVGKPPIKPSPIEWLRFAFIKHAPKMVGGETVGIYTAPIKPWPHQEIVARRLVETYPYGYLLCDEVGLGKTIENGLAFRALWLSGRARRILICPPASLVRQWRGEMMRKFLMPFGIARSNGNGARVSYLVPPGQDDNTEDIEERRSLFDRELIIVSTGLLQREERLRQLANAEALDSIQSVIARDAKVETPVSSEELSSVLAKRLFTHIDPAAAQATAEEYRRFYTRGAT